jgi:hypothetical protein
MMEAEDLAGGRNSGKLGDDVAEVDQEAGDHHKEGGAKAEFLANEVGEAFARDHAHARAHFHGHVKGHGHRNEGPQQSVAVGRSSLSVGGDTAGVVIHVGSDDARADDGQEQEETAAPSIGAGKDMQDAGAQGVDPIVDGGEVHERNGASGERRLATGKTEKAHPARCLRRRFSCGDTNSPQVMSSPSGKRRHRP